MSEKKRNWLLALAIISLLLIMSFGSYYVQNVQSRRVEQAQAVRHKRESQQTREKLEKAGVEVKNVSDKQLREINQHAKEKHQSVVKYVREHPKALSDERN